MWRGKLSLIVVLVLGAIACDASAELVLRYSFNDGTASDSAHYYEDADGTFFGDAKVVTDENRGSVLDLDGSDDYVRTVNSEVADFGTGSFSYSFWAKTGVAADWFYFWKGIDYTGEETPDNLHGANCYHDDSVSVRFSLYNYSGVGTEEKVRTDVSDTNCVTGTWAHIACVRDTSVNQLRFYINGELEPTGEGGGNPVTETLGDLSNPGYLYIGCSDRGYPQDENGNPNAFFNGRIDEFRVYSHALSDEELLQLASDYGDPNLASEPIPQDGSPAECLDVVLSWTAGNNAASHDVYFGTDGQDVKDANTLDGEFRVNQPGTTYDAGLLESLEPGETYYWRIDEVNDNGWAPSGSPWKGDVWRFSTNDGKAHSPEPRDGEQMLDLEQIVSWSAGCWAASHDVYFGTDFNDVSDGATVAYQGNQGVEDADFDPHDWDPCGLDYSTWYYWRIDEVNGPNTWPGNVWSFKTEGFIFDPNLRVWYKFDETEGDRAADSSGREHYGDLAGGPVWDANGYNDGCLSFDEDGHVVVPTPVLGEIDKQITICVWLNNSVSGSHENVVIAAGADWEDYYLRVAVPDDSTDVYWRAGGEANDVFEWNGGNPAVWEGSWNHFGFVKDEDAGTMEIYLNGVKASGFAGASSGTLARIRDRRIRIGAETDETGDYRGRVDDLMVYDRALSADEIAGIFRGGDLGIAWGPDPYDGQADVARDANLVWRPGDYAAQHKAYFGMSWEDVNSMSDPCATTTPGNENYNPGILELETSYYWRIDEVNGPNTWKGPVWSFTVADFLILDDFEQYDLDQKRVQYTWYDQYSQEWGEATGAWLELARPPKPVHLGDQAVSYTYDTDDPWADFYYAEAWLPLEEIGGQQDWTDAGVTVLRLFFYGDSGNDATDAEQMYVGVDDTFGTYAEMRYGDNAGEALSDLLVEEWQSWDIPYSYFSDGNFAAVADDVDFSSIANLYIGFGDKRNPVAAGKGVVYFDDIRLSLPICIPEYGPEADFSGNCIVDIADVGIMGVQWLNHDVNFADELGIEVQQPSDSNLVGHWKLDEGSGTFAEDSSVNDYHGTLEMTEEGGYSWVDGRIGPNAVDFSGGRAYVNDGGNTPKLRPVNQVSVCAWIYIREPMSSARCVVKGNNDHESYELEIDSVDTFIFQFRDGNHPDHTRYDVNGTVWASDWIHVAGTYDGSTVACYVNGELDNSKAIDNPYGLSQDPNYGLSVGNKARGDANDTPFEGIIDDVRVYDYGLSPAEVAWLATEGTGEFLITTPVNLISGEDPDVINLRDFAKLMESWLDEKLWPPE